MVSGGRTGAPGQFPARAREVAGIAERVALEIVLVLRLGLPEFAGGRDLRHNAAWPQAGGVDIVDCPECLVTLRLGDIEDLRAVRSSDIVTLAVQCGRIVNLEEELQKVAIADAFRVELDLDGLSVRSMVAIGRVRHIAARVSDTCVDYARQLADRSCMPQKQPPASTARSSLLVIISPLFPYVDVNVTENTLSVLQRPQDTAVPKVR